MLVLVQLALFSCVSGIPEEKILSGAPENRLFEGEVFSLFSHRKGVENAVVHGRAALSLPEGWRFLLSYSGPEGSRSLYQGKPLFRFTDPQGRISGLCAVFGADVKMNLAGNAAELYRRALPEAYTVNRTVKTETYGGEAILLHGGSPEEERSFVTLLYPDSQDMYVVEVTGPEKLIREQSRIISEVLHNFGTVEAGSSLRVRTESELWFHSFNGPWRWRGDVENGFILSNGADGMKFSMTTSAEEDTVRIHTDIRVHVKVALTLLPEGQIPKELREHINRADSNRLEIPFAINNRERKTEVITGSAGESPSWGVFTFSANEERYAVYLLMDGASSEKQVKAVCTSDAVQQLFERNLLFRGRI
jgi:hypothetical protein